MVQRRDYHSQELFAIAARTSSPSSSFAIRFLVNSDFHLAAPTSGHEEQELVGNQAIAEIIRAQNNPTGERALNPNKNGIVYMGLRTMNLVSSMSKESFLWNDFSNNVKNFW